MARPRQNIDPSRVIELAAKGHTVKEIAAFVDVDRRTIQRRFAAQCEKGHLLCAGMIRAKQFERAMAGSDTMLIWLGKQLLDQRDKQEMEHTGNVEHSVAIDKLKALTCKMMKRDENDCKVLEVAPTDAS